MELPTQKFSVFLTFTGNAEQAIRFYETVLPNASIQSLTFFEKDMPGGDEGKLLNGTLAFGGQSILFMDMQAAYPAPPFSWSTSLLIDCTDEAEFDLLFEKLSQNGTVMMGPEAVMGIRKCAWVTDKFGITWQLVWE